jgi:RimJ/RimL family protein N-acetyltransferase
MADAIDLSVSDWRQELPVLTARSVTLREPSSADLGPLFDLLSLADASRYGIDDPITELSVLQFIERVARQRSTGAAFAFAITPGTSRNVIGLVYVRQLDMAFEAAEWEATLAPSARGTGAFLDTARLVGSFAFGTVGTHRLEARVLVQNGRANGALRKLGAVQEGVLRRSLRRRGEYFDQVLWSVLKDDWGEHWVSTAPRVH